MSDFKAIAPIELNENIFTLIGKDWMLVTAGTPERFNTMTASWGGAGVLWNKNVCHVYVRPSRYTYEFIENSGELTLSFFNEDMRDALKFCGSHSGRDCDKVKECSLTPIPCGDCVSFDEARLIIKCRVLYKQDMREDCFIDKALLSNYKDGDFHRAYTCEIEEILIK